MYLVRRSEKGVIVERLVVGKEGIPGEKFEQVARELLDEKVAALEAGETCGGS